MAAGGAHSVALRSVAQSTLKTVWTWGYNEQGQLGHSSASRVDWPTQVRGLRGMTAIAAGGVHTLAVGSDGRAWAWGDNTWGQLGDGSRGERRRPVPVVGLTGVSAVTASPSHSAALLQDGTVWTWGDNATGQLGDGTSTPDRPNPVRIPR